MLEKPDTPHLEPDIHGEHVTTSQQKRGTMLHAARQGPDPPADGIHASAANNVSVARSDGKLHLLLAASGSVASIKLVQIINGLASHRNLSIRLVLTAAAEHFLAGQSAEQPSLAEVRRMPNVDGIYTDAAEWTRPWTRGAPILHIEMRRWADLMIVAPLSANTMAKMVAGICDTLLLSIVRAWDTDGSVDGVRKKIVVCVAMNTAMWRNPVTARNLRTLEEDWGGADGWVEVLRPISKTLACNDTGDGAMVGWEEIVAVAEAKLGLTRPVMD
ncbi:putative thymidylate synthase [Tolypocladium ophioglossoides CBS 100239]|uniref:Putative thymidylate synthase n=1 Tax=Tolypocladium ophioglossoides (strain CBS 100239) TaxID=1163406 RepID=A0A0L0MXX0_TOLOC|nr:putative thymidylate synthase [Tolypocladium ophioglossoides CBS 100239]